MELLRGVEVEISGIDCAVLLERKSRIDPWEFRCFTILKPEKAHDKGVEAMRNQGAILTEIGLTLLDGYDLGSLRKSLEPLTQEEKRKLSVPFKSKGLSEGLY